MHPMPGYSREYVHDPALASRSGAGAESATTSFVLGFGTNAFGRNAMLPSLGVSAPLTTQHPSVGPHLAPLRSLSKACRLMGCPNVAASLHGYCADHAHNELDAYKPQESTPILPPLRPPTGPPSCNNNPLPLQRSSSDVSMESYPLPSLPSIHMSVLNPPGAPLVLSHSTSQGQAQSLQRSPLRLPALLPPSYQSAMMVPPQPSMNGNMNMNMNGNLNANMNMSPAVPMTVTVESRGASSKPIVKCRRENCPNAARRKGLCMEHGGRHFCKMEGCSKCAHRGGYCIAHGGGRRCAVQNCTKSAQSGGVCYSHGGGKRCATDGCTHAARSGGFCIKHGKQRKHHAQSSTAAARAYSP